MTTEDVDKIKEALERLKNSQMEIGKSIYSQGNTETSEEPQPEEPPKEEEKAEEKTEE